MGRNISKCMNVYNIKHLLTELNPLTPSAAFNRGCPTERAGMSGGNFSGIFVSQKRAVTIDVPSITSRLAVR
jgi:hypothetical protein